MRRTYIVGHGVAGGIVRRPYIVGHGVAGGIVCRPYIVGHGVAGGIVRRPYVSGFACPAWILVIGGHAFLSLLRLPRRVFRVFRPSSRVVRNVLPNPIQRGFIPDNVFVVIALPDRCAGGTPQDVDAFRHSGFI